MAQREVFGVQLLAVRGDLLRKGFGGDCELRMDRMQKSPVNTGVKATFYVENMPIFEGKIA